MKLSRRIGTEIGMIAAAGLAALTALTGTAHASASDASGTTATTCRAWTGAHPSYAVRLTGVDALSPCDIWATGVPGVDTKSATVTDLLHWNGVTWSLHTSATVPASLSQPPAVTAVSAGDAWVAGTYVSTSAAFAQTLTARWNGTAFTRVASRDPASMGDDSLDGISAAGANNIWAVGFYNLFDTNYDIWASLPLTEHWNGHAWTWVDAPIPAAPPTAPTPLDQLNAVTAVCGCGAWAVGEDQLQGTPTSSARQITLAEHWNGSAWQISPTPNNGNADTLLAVSAAGKNDVWAVGHYGSPAKTLTEHWNGVKWTIVPSPSPGVQNGKANGALLGVTVIGARDAWAVGDYVSGSGGKDQSLVLHWNGSTWQRVAIAHFGPKGAANVLTAVSASSSGSVIAAGYYSGVAGQQALVLRLP
jgi:hypothetical protein